MSSSLRVNTIVPSTGTNVAIGTANGTVTFTDSVNFVLGTGSSIFSPASNTLTFGTNDAERLRIDSDGNVLVGTTDATIYNNGDSDSEGIVLRGGEVIDIARKGDLQLTLNRQTNDGFHVGFFRSGSPKSYIATRDDAFCIDVNNSERLRITSDGKVRVPDNGKFVAGAGDDLQIYHDGSHSYVLDNGTGDLRLASNSITRITKGDSETCAAFNVDGASELYYDNTKRFETISNGTQTTGRIHLNGTNGGLDYNNIAHTLEYIVNGSTHSELNTGAYVPAGSKNLGANAHRWGTLYLSNGIDFASTSDASGMTSEVLDDYEEGTWTPTITGLGNHNNTAASTWGKYTKIGNRVFITFRYQWTSRTTTNGGVIFLGSLPFSATNDSRSDAVYIGGLEGVISNTGREFYGGHVVHNTNTIQFRASGHNTSENSLFGSLSTSMSSGYIYGAANYIV